MEPYTAEGMRRREEEDELQGGSSKRSSASLSMSQSSKNLEATTGSAAMDLHTTPTKCP